MHLQPHGGVPCGHLTEEEKTRAWFTDGSVRCADTTQKWTALQPLSGTTLKGAIKGKSSQWAKLSPVRMGVYVAVAAQMIPSMGVLTEAPEPLLEQVA